MITTDLYGDLAKITGELNEASVVVQGFTAVDNYLSRISLNIGTYKRRNTCDVVFAINDNVTDEFVFKKKYSASVFIDNAYFTIPVELDLVVGRKYDVVVNTNGKVGNTITLKYGAKKHQQEKMMVGNNVINGELACIFEYGKQELVKPIVDASKYTSGLISIIVPVYNSSQYLNSLFNSIGKQHYNFLEVIVVDDGSSNSYNFDEIARKYKKIKTKFIKLPSNNGACHARNIGKSTAKGEFLFFCDSDVVLEVDILSDMIQSLHNNKQCDWVYCNFNVGHQKRSFCEFNPLELTKRSLCSTMSLIRHSANPTFDVNLKRLQDWDMFLTLSEQGKRGVWINKFLFSAVDRPGITRNSISWNEAMIPLKRKHKIF